MLGILESFSQKADGSLAVETPPRSTLFGSTTRLGPSLFVDDRWGPLEETKIYDAVGYDDAELENASMTSLLGHSCCQVGIRGGDATWR